MPREGRSCQEDRVWVRMSPLHKKSLLGTLYPRLQAARRIQHWIGIP